MRHFLFPIVGLLLSVTPAALHAATITQTFTFADMANYGSENGTSIAAFDPALGTLNSVSFSLDATSTLIPPAVQGETANYFFTLNGPNGVVLLTESTGQPLITFSGSFTPASGISFNTFLGPGTVTSAISFEVSPFGEPGSGYSTTFQVGTATYNYTPAVTPAPEASSLGLLGCGLIFCGFLSRRVLCKAPVS